MESSKEIMCKKCGRKFIGNSQFVTHVAALRNNSCATFECKICGEKFGYVLKLYEHVSKKHKNEMEPRDQMVENKNEDKGAKQMNDFEKLDTFQDEKGDEGNVKTTPNGH